MSKLLPPLCLLLALLTMIAAFAVLMTDRPRVDVELHQARVGDDEAYRELLEERLDERRARRNYLIAALVASAVLFAALAFLSMRPAQATS